ncbi:hypothetical protein Bca4012_057334 [Brassica carinata]
MAKKKSKASQAKTKKKSVASHEPEPPPTTSAITGHMQPDPRLPQRLFATDRFPIKTLNIYSSPEILPFLRHVLRDTPEFQIIRKSSFGKLFDIPARQCPSSFGGQPLRFGLEEFGTVTGLNCGSFSDGYHPDKAKSVVAGKDGIWKNFFGKKKIVTIAELCRMLEEEKNMSGWKNIRIALKMYTTRRLENQAKQLDQTLHQLRSLMEPKPIKSATTEKSTQYPAINIAVAALALGTMAWLYVKFSN